MARLSPHRRAVRRRTRTAPPSDRRQRSVHRYYQEARDQFEYEVEEAQKSGLTVKIIGFGCYRGASSVTVTVTLCDDVHCLGFI